MEKTFIEKKKKTVENQANSINPTSIFLLTTIVTKTRRIEAYRSQQRSRYSIPSIKKSNILRYQG